MRPNIGHKGRYAQEVFTKTSEKSLRYENTVSGIRFAVISSTVALCKERK
jgi:hypothetical protein